jgi:toxin ParE1/3/4
MRQTNLWRASSRRSLIRYPLAGREGRVPGTRELAVTRTPYVIPYRICGDEIQILAVIHGAQRWATAFRSE